MDHALESHLHSPSRRVWTESSFWGETFPLHPDAASPLEAALRNVLSVCCLSDTVAVALIGAERVEMPDSDLREVPERKLDPLVTRHGL